MRMKKTLCLVLLLFMIFNLASCFKLFDAAIKDTETEEQSERDSLTEEDSDLIEESETESESVSQTEDESETITDTEPQTETESETERIVNYIDLTYLNSRGTRIFVDIVYPSKGQEFEINAANNVATAMGMLTSANVYKPSYNKLYNENTVEILVGDVGYPETDMLSEGLGYGEGAIGVVGNKLVVVGFDEAALNYAVDQLRVILTSCRDDDGNIRVGDDINTFVSANPVLSSIPVYVGKSPSVTDMGDNSYKIVFDGGKEASFRDYLVTLSRDKYRLYTQNKMDGNEYYT